MPMHDWTRVTPNDYHDFHFAWIAAIRQALNTGILPPGYYAMAEHTAPPYVPDVLTLTQPRNDESLDTNGDSAVGSGGTTTIAMPTKRVGITLAGKKPIGRRRVAVRHMESRRLVAVIEIVSPSNKARKAEFADLRDKSIELLHSGVHLLLIDPFPPTARDPQGLHDAIWRALTGKRIKPPADKPLTLVAYAALGGNMFSAFAEPFAVGDKLADMELFLAPEKHILTPLEETYQTAWAGFPIPLRPMLESAPNEAVVPQ